MVDELNVEFREEKGTISSFVLGPKDMKLNRKASFELGADQAVMKHTYIHICMTYILE